MMTEWLSYSLSDFLPFSERVYFRQLELANQAVWPAHILALAAGVALAFFVYAPTSFRSRLSALLLGLAWFSSGWFFIWERYAEINWAGAHIAALFALQGAGLCLLAISKRGLGLEQQKVRSRTASALLILLVTLVYPAQSIFGAHSIQSAEVFAIAPDPTALLTMCVLAVAAIPFRLVFFVVPTLWCLLSALTLTAMGSHQTWIIVLSLLLIFTLTTVKRAK